MSLWHVILAVVSIAVVLGLVNWLGGYLKADPQLMKIINVICVVIVIIWLVSLTGIFGFLNDVKVPQVR